MGVVIAVPSGVSWRQRARSAEQPGRPLRWNPRIARTSTPTRSPGTPGPRSGPIRPDPGDPLGRGPLADPDGSDDDGVVDGSPADEFINDPDAIRARNDEVDRP